LQVWSEAAAEDVTFVAITIINGTVIGLRDRESGTLYLSSVILGNQVNPTLGKILLAVQMEAINDYMRRAGEQGWDGGQIPKPDTDGIYAPFPVSIVALVIFSPLTMVIAARRRCK
jgi:hypothetical protein